MRNVSCSRSVPEGLRDSESQFFAVNRDAERQGHTLREHCADAAYALGRLSEQHDIFDFLDIL